MTIRVVLRHSTTYAYDRLVDIGPQIIRLRPAPHCRTPIPSYSLKVDPDTQFLNWQQDPYGNFLARLVFNEPARRLAVTVDLSADMTVINPFDFFVEEAAEVFPFRYDDSLKQDLKPFLRTDEPTAVFADYFETLNRSERRTVDFLVELNQKLQSDIGYLIRMEPGVQSCEETLGKRSGSCRDSAWLLVQILRHCGLAARFVSGYLIQLKPDLKSLDGPSGADEDFTDLHAWTEVYLPGAGWIGLDPTSGLLAGEGHIPLAATPEPQSAAPISGSVGKCEVTFDFEMEVVRVQESPRVTKPYTDSQWKAIVKLGHEVETRLASDDVRLTMGGEPTFVSIDDMEGPEWNSDAVGQAKRRLSSELLMRLRDRFAPNGLLHFGQGKWYPGESLPRWADTCMWRADGQAIWQQPELLALPHASSGLNENHAAEFIGEFSERLGVEPKWIRPAYEDVLAVLAEENRLPPNIDPAEFDIEAAEDRIRLRKILERGVSRVAGFVLPLTRAWWQASPRWMSGPWPLRSSQLFLIPGDSPLGLRLPIDSLPAANPIGPLQPIPLDPMVPRDAFEPQADLSQRIRQQQVSPARIEEIRTVLLNPQGSAFMPEPDASLPGDSVVRTAMCIEPRDGRLHVFMPPVSTADDYLELVAAVEATAARMKVPVVVEGYLPPKDSRLKMLQVTPDPGVLEVNVQPAANWKELVDITTGIYEDARATRLGTEKFELDGTHTGTGGGNHIVVGGATPMDSPFLRRPHLLRSIVGYWNNHPSLSYLFSGRFVGPTCQAPRVDEGRQDALYELRIAFEQIPDHTEVAPWLVDRVFRNLLVDVTGNTHRAELCIDKLYSPDSASGRLGLLELRSFEMPPHAQMSLAQQLLVRSLIAMFWESPWQQQPIDWGTSLHDRFMLPHFLRSDLDEVLSDLRQAGMDFDREWFAPHLEFRLPPIGEVEYDCVRMELRHAIEPWYVLGEEPGGGGTTRFVDSSVERLQVLAHGLTPDRYQITCNGRPVPLTSTGRQGEYVAGVRYRAWQPPRCLHPTIGVHTPLSFDIVDCWQQRSIGGCIYHVDHPGGSNSNTFPVNALEAESRRAARFSKIGFTGGLTAIRQEQSDPDFPLTLDLRRRPDSS